MCTCSYICMQAHVPLIHHSRLSLGRKKEIFSYSYNRYIFAELLYSHFCLPSPFSFSFLSPSFAFFFMCLGKTEDHKPVDFIVVDNYRESWDLELNRCETQREGGRKEGRQFYQCLYLAVCVCVCAQEERQSNAFVQNNIFMQRQNYWRRYRYSFISCDSKHTPTCHRISTDMHTHREAQKYNTLMQFLKSVDL